MEQSTLVIDSLDLVVNCNKYKRSQTHIGTIPENIRHLFPDS